jgi:hypothetical protein
VTFAQFVQPRTEDEPPRSVVDGAHVRLRVSEAGIDVPSGIAGIDLARKANHKGSEIWSVLPSVGIQQLMNGIEEPRRVCRLAQGLPLDKATNDRLQPTRRVIFVNAELFCRQLSTLACECRRDRP